MLCVFTIAMQVCFSVRLTKVDFFVLLGKDGSARDYWSLYNISPQFQYILFLM